MCHPTLPGGLQVSICRFETTTETNCWDGLDDDCDGLIDGADPDCGRAPPPGGLCNRNGACDA